MGQTSNYQWNQPEYWDRAARLAWSQTLSAIDTAVAAKADISEVNSALAQLQAADTLKADSASVDSRFARVNSDIAALDSRFTAVNSDINALENRVSVIVGKYTGDGASTRAISLGFTPKAVLLEHSSGLREFGDGILAGGLALQGAASSAFQVITAGFSVKYTSGINHTNENNTVYRYLAFK